MAHQLLAAAVATAIAIAPASAQQFVADVTQTYTMRYPLLTCMGSGHAALAMRQDYRQHLTQAVRDIGFTHVRGHGVLDDDMSTYLNGQANMFNVISMYEFYLSLGVRPIVELSFMPEELANNTAQTIMHYKGITSPPKNYSAWGVFIQQFTSILVQHFGVDEVRQWRFEVWNEPQGCGFWCGGQAGYFELYRQAALAIKSVDPYIPVGGPATAELSWLPDIVNFTQSTGTPIDFISTHSYPTDPSIAHVRSGFEDGVIAAASVAQAAGLPFLLTEFSAGLDNGAYDTPYAAAFLVHTQRAFQNATDVGMLSYWTFTDIFEEPGFISAPYDQKFGAQSVYGVPKPAYRALQWIQALGATGVEVNGSQGATAGTVDVMVTIDTSAGPTQTGVTALLTNWNLIGRGASWALPCNASTVSLGFAGIPSARAPVSATVAFINSTSGYAKPVWQAFGSPTYPNASEIAAEMAASVPAAFTLAFALQAGVPTLTLDMEAYSVAYVTFAF